MRDMQTQQKRKKQQHDKSKIDESKDDVLL